MDLIQQIRNGSIPTNEEIGEILTLNSLTTIRNQIVDTDLNIILDWYFYCKSINEFRLVIHLFQGLYRNSHNPITKSRIRGILEGAWPNARNDPEKGRSVAAALLEVPDLPEATHNFLFEFLIYTWADGKDYVINLCRGADNIAPMLRERIEDSEYPATKKWAYVLALGYSTDKEAVIALLNEIEEKGSLDPTMIRSIQYVRNLIEK